MTLSIEDENNWLLEQARLIAHNAYAPYSNIHVGCCVLYENGDYFLGCNVENASFGLSLCAERNALSNAVAAGEKAKIRTVAIACLERKNFMPCGACRQWLSEFSQISGNDIQIILEDEKNQVNTYRISELLPKSFKL